jgi:hypothetical protein
MVYQREDFNDSLPNGFAFKDFMNSNGRRMETVATVQIENCPLYLPRSFMGPFQLSLMAKKPAHKILSGSRLTIANG